MPAKRRKKEIRFNTVREAIYKAIVSNDYLDIDTIIDMNINSLTKAQNGKTSIFSAVERMLGSSENFDESQRPHVIDAVCDTLSHIFIRANTQFGQDKKLLDGLIHATCNHISHTSLLPSGATLRDIMESYAGINMNKHFSREYEALYNISKRFGLLSKHDVAQERIGYMLPQDERGMFL
ncbi:MAG: hypothetical protein KGJ06_07130 [Pseudomonadota bacterium]|nr:hypothetical protein [Pseudomonadota bacterium]